MLGLPLLIYSGFIGLVALLLLILTFRPTPKPNWTAKPDYAPKVLVIIPCKGQDIELTRNLASSKKQTYKNYDVIAIPDSATDSSMESIKAAGLNFMLQDYECKECSGKVKSLATAFSKLRAYDVYVTLDSDADVAENWLSSIIAPLSDPKIGLSTSFPVFKPIKGFWSKVKYVWGFVGMSMMESPSTRFGWGGTLAFRKDLLTDDDLRYFGESLSDDMALTNIAKRKGLEIAYVPEASPVIDCDDSFAQFSEWANRQTALSINGPTNRSLFHYGMVFYGASILVLLSGIIMAIWVSSIYLLLLLPFLAGLAKTLNRSGHSLTVLYVYPLINFVYFANLIKAKSMKSINWRGRTYPLK